MLLLLLILCCLARAALSQQAAPSVQHTLKPVAAMSGAPRRDFCGVRSPATGMGRPLKVIFVVSFAYLEVMLNWLIFYQRICPDRSLLYFLCTDLKVKDRLETYGMACDAMLNVQGSVFNVWKVRARVATDLLSRGIDVLMSDADAIWLRNPFVAIEKYIDSADIIASRGLFPELLSRKYGATVCMGFIYLKSTHNVISIWGELAKALNASKRVDDQNEVNFLLWRKGLRYHAPAEPPPATTATATSTTKKRISRQEQQQDHPHKVGYINTTTEAIGEFFVETVPSKIVLLAHENFKRTCEGEPLLLPTHDATVAHCYTLKFGVLKHRGLYLMELWLLRQDWAAIPYRNSTELFFNDITMAYTGVATPVYAEDEESYSRGKKSEHRKKKGQDAAYEDKLVKAKRLAKSTVQARAPVGRKNTRTYSDAETRSK